METTGHPSYLTEYNSTNHQYNTSYKSKKRILLQNYINNISKLLYQILLDIFFNITQLSFITIYYFPDYFVYFIP